MKKQKIQLIIIAVLLVIFITGYFMIKNSNLKDEDDSEETSDIKVTNVVSGDVVEMEYLKDGQTLDFIKDGDSWYYKDDRSIPIIQTDLTTMLDYACSISTKTVIDAPEDLKTYGLNNPSNTISLTLKDGSIVQIIFGDYLSITGDYYAMVSGDDNIYAISSYYATSFDKTLDDLTEKETSTEK